MLEPLPDLRERVIVVGTSVRKPLPVLRHFLDSLDWQELPPRTRPHYCFVADYPNPKDEARQYLADWVATRNGELLGGGPTASNDFTDQHPVTHQWTPNAMQRVGRNKNRILRRALELRADHIFLADADLILDRTVLQSLLHVQRPIACAVYWTHWQREPSPEVTVHAGPQVWLRHPYEMDGRGLDKAEFRERLITRQLTQVWGQGACTLLDPRVVEAGVDFSPQPEVPTQGLMAGEDRHFCIAAERRHIEMWADPWPDIFHIYHLPDDLKTADTMRERLGTPHPDQPRLGDWINVVIQAMEGVSQPNGTVALVPPQMIRGRLGGLAMATELEEAIYEMRRGESRIVPVHFPIHYVVPQFRGQRRLLRVTLVDTKPWGYAPVVEEELYVGPRSGRVLDAVTLTPEQHQGIKEVANV